MNRESTILCHVVMVCTQGLFPACSLIGWGLDNSAAVPDTSLVTISSLKAPGEDLIVVTLNDGSVFSGTYEGLDSAPLDEFAKEYVQWQATAIGFHPSLGDSLTVRTSARQISGTLKAFTHNSIFLVVRQYDPATKMQYAATKEIEAEFVRAVSQANGMSVDGETFRNDLSSGAIPCVTRLVLGLPGRRYDVPVNSIQRIQQPGVRRTYTTVGAILDGVTCVALAYALVRNLPSGKVLP